MDRSGRDLPSTGRNVDTPSSSARPDVSTEPLYRRVLAGSAKLAFGLVGEHLAHSHSPLIHERLGSVPYDIVEVPRDDAAAFLSSRQYCGLNVTIPYKFEAARAADEVSPAVERLGNANTLVVRENGALFADNTDYYGFERLVRSTGVDVSGLTALVLGDGGAAQTVKAVLSDMGVAELVVATRTGDLRFSDLARGGAAHDVLERVGVVVNATPCGMYPHVEDALLVDLTDMPSLRAVVDLVYNPLNTRLVQQARDLGVPATGGLLMLVAQAKRSSDLFLGCPDRDDDVLDGVYEHLLADLTTIALIGMPGCGKSSTGRALARMLGKEFVDVDALIPGTAGKSIARIFSEDGEDAFREIETACTAEAFSKPGRVVSCGGGVVTRCKNLAYLRQNGPIVLLTRGLDAGGTSGLATSGRPMSVSRGVETLRAEREQIYRAWADIQVPPAPTGPLATALHCARILVERGAALEAGW